MTPSGGGDSADRQRRALTAAAGSARAARARGEKVTRGQSETALRKQSAAWAAGAVGEQRVARKLGRIRRSGFVVLHDRLVDPGKAWNIDHLVVGPAGVFFVDAKNWRGRITVPNGVLTRTWFAGPAQGTKTEKMVGEVDKVRSLASYTAARLGCPVTPVLCLCGAQSRHFEGAVTVRGVVVVSMDRLVPWLESLPPRLRPDEVAVTGQVARTVLPAAVPEVPEEQWVARMRR